MKDLEAQLIHDLRNATAVIRTASLQLRSSGETMPPATRGHLIDMIARRSDMLLHLLNDLTVTCEMDRGDLTVSLQSVAWGEICDFALAQRTLPDGTRVLVDVDADAVVIGDPVRLTQMLDNLLTNALRYGGPHVTVRSARLKDTVRLEVCDDGEGVPESLVEHLFTPYTRGSSSHSVGGSGLGLAIVRALAEALGGTVAYDSVEGPRFTITLPAAPRDPRGGGKPTGGHHATVWRERPALAAEVAEYAADALAGGEAVFLATRPALQHLIDAELKRLGHDPGRMQDQGQLKIIDAHEVGRLLEQGDHVSAEAFETLVGIPVKGLLRRWRSVCAYSEIVDVFCEDGRPDLAAELERYWEALRARRPFALRCGYRDRTECDEAQPDPAPGTVPGQTLLRLHDSVPAV